MLNCVLVQAFVPELPVEALDERILLRYCRKHSGIRLVEHCCGNTTLNYPSKAVHQVLPERVYAFWSRATLQSPSYARAFFLSGIIFFAKKAETIGLVHDVIEPDKLGSETSRVVKQFLKAGPVALREGKILIKNLTPTVKAKDIDYTCETIARLRVSSEAQEGMNALLEKRAPNWVK